MALKGVLHITTGWKDNRTFLSNSYCTPPFKLADVTEDASRRKLQLMMMTSSPGVLDGDQYHLRIELGEHSDVSLKTQSYQRLFEMKKGARQVTEIFLGESSRFVYLPQPVVPHQNANFSTINNIHLSGQSTLMLGEVLTPGRQLNGEVFSFTRYHSTTQVYLDNRLIVKDNLLLEPAARPVGGMGLLEGYTHQASFLVIQADVDFAN